MTARTSRCRRTWPTPKPITMDCLGRGDDGNLYVWSYGATVQPMKHFPRIAPNRVQSGHYVIEWHGKALTVHVANAAEAGTIEVQFMCSAAASFPFGIRFEEHLLGRVMDDLEEQESIADMLRRMKVEALARQTAPHRKRGAA